MPSAIGQRLDLLIHEISQIKKILILQEIHKKSQNSAPIMQWNALCQKISDEWDSVSVCDEIRQQREKLL